MAGDAVFEIEAIKGELSNIVNELYDISDALRSNFEGCGTDICASRVSRMADRYNAVKKFMDEMDTVTVTEQFSREHPELAN